MKEPKWGDPIRYPKISFDKFSTTNYLDNGKKAIGRTGKIIYTNNTPNAFFRVGWDGETVKE